MGKRQQYKRLVMLALLLVLAFAGLGYRLVDLQILQHETLSAKAQQRTQREMAMQPRRGDIVDARGNLLATSVYVKRVAADPTLMMGRQAEVARTLAPLLQLNEREIFQKLQPRIVINERGETNTVQYVVLKREVSPETWQKISQAMAMLDFGLDEKRLNRREQEGYSALRRKAIIGEDVQRRVYPNQNLAVHVLGYANGEDGAIRGREGIELTFDAQLKGARGWRLTEKDGRGREIIPLREQDVQAQDGLNVVLTLDGVIQHFAEAAIAEAYEKFSPESISCVVVRPRTGEILAMASLPGYDPNHPGDPSIAPAARRNPVLEHVMEPGSTFKTLVVAAALNERLVSLDDVFFCENGEFLFGGRRLRDSEGHRYGNMTVQEIMMKSSNIGAAKVGMKLGPERLYRYIHDFGFGSRTALPLPAEVNPQVRPLKDWYKISIVQIPMGQGINVTRMQMTMAVAAIANKGVLMRPILVDRLEDRQGNVLARFSPQPIRRVVNEAAARQTTEALKSAVTTDGTGYRAALEHYTVAGKTGTAQKAGPGGYGGGRYFASFIGFFPADNPEICISVILDEPDVRKGYYGGTTAAPVFKSVAERTARYLNLKPEINPAAAPGTVAQATAP